MDWVRTKADEHALDQGCWFDQQAADRVRFFFERFLRHSKGPYAGKKFELLDWQWKDLIAPAFGWKRSDGTRRFRRVYCEVPKKNGKSTISAGVGLYLLCGDNEPGAEVYFAAADRDQAGIVFGEAAHMVEASKALARHLKVYGSRKTILDPKSRSLCRALSAEHRTKEGFNISGLVVDELHVQPNRHLIDTLEYGGAARVQPLFFYITTAGWDRTSICWEMHKYAESILKGLNTDTSFLPLIYAAPEGADWTAEATWKTANPSYGITIRPDQMREDCLKAQAQPARQNTFKRYRLNIWTMQNVLWLNVAKWRDCYAEYTDESLHGETCTAGLDLASTTDIAALTLWFPEHRRMLQRFWVPAGADARRAESNRIRYREWIDAGYIKETAGDVIDYDVIRQDINDLSLVFNIKSIGIDRWNATQISTQLMTDGFDVVSYGQSMLAMSPPSKRFESMILDGEIQHNGNPVMEWMVGNAAAQTDAYENLRPCKKASADKIDGVTSTVIAIGVASVDDSGYPTVSWI